MSNDSPVHPRVGVRFGPYDLRAPQGRGGMGEVYEACAGPEDRAVALVLLPPQFARDGERMERLRRESQAAGRPSLLPSGRCAA